MCEPRNIFPLDEDQVEAGRKPVLLEDVPVEICSSYTESECMIAVDYTEEFDPDINDFHGQVGHFFIYLKK